MTKEAVSNPNYSIEENPIINDLEFNPNPQQLSDFLAQTIIQFLNPISIDSTPQLSKSSPDFIQAIQELVQILAHLRSPNGAWPSNIPQTPENLIPYVSEEVYGVLETYKQHLSNPDLFSSSSNQTNPNVYIPNLILVKDLIPKLLWLLAQSSYELMRLLTGIKSEILLPNQDWQIGKLRLVPYLIFKNDVLNISIDLATNTIFSNPLSKEAYLQSNDFYLCHHPLQAQSLLSQVKAQMQNKNLFIPSNQARILEPKQNWQPIQIYLDFELEFIPESETPKISFIETSLKSYNLTENLSYASPEVQNVEYSVLASLATPSLLETQIRLTDPKIIQPYAQTKIQQYWWCWLIQKNNQTLPTSTCSHPISNDQQLLNSNSQTEDSLLMDFIHLADELIDIIYNPTSVSSLATLQPELSLVELSLRLLWQLISSSYTLMQLISGIKAKLLQPGYNWETGTLRLLAVFNANFSNETWEIDIATSQTLKFDLHTPAPESIIQSDNCEWCQFPQSIEFLIKQTTELLQTSPELKSWMNEAKLDWGTPNQTLELPLTWQTGFAQLSVGFEWIKDYPTP